MKCLVLGGTGFIGSNLAQRLLTDGYNTWVLTRQAGLRSNDRRLHYVIGDICDGPFLKRLFQRNGFDLVYNCAGVSGQLASFEHPRIDYRVNVSGAVNVLQAARGLATKPLVVYLSTRLVYGKARYLPVDESHPVNPLSPHAKHKLLGEKKYIWFNRTYGIPATIFRVSNPYGPHPRMTHHRYSVVNWIIDLAKRDKQIPIFGDGSQKRDYLYIADLVDLLVQVGQSRTGAGQIYNVGSGRWVRFGKMVEKVIRIVGRGRAIYVPWPKSYLKVETGDYVSDISKVNRAYAWRPRVNLSVGIKRSISPPVPGGSSLWKF